MSCDWIMPRRRLRSPTTSPTWSCGVVTSTSMIGSRMIGPAFFMPSRKQALAAISNASADESTSWYLPSTRVYLKSTVGKPASTPVSACTLMPFSTAGMYSFGTEPPTTVFDELDARSLRSFGSKAIFTSAYWPEPPDCFLWV